MNDLKKSVEAVLFAAARTVSLEELTRLIGVKDESALKKVARELKEDLDAKDSPIMVVEENNGWKLVVREKFLPTVQQIVPHTDLSRPILETLAVVAWKQPARQSDIVKYRGSTAYEHIHELEKLGYLSREKQGRSFKVRVTNKFFEYFDLPKEKLKELFKDVKDVEEAAQKTLEALKENKEAVKHAGDKHLGRLEVYDSKSGRGRGPTETLGQLEVFEEPSEEEEEEVEVLKNEEAEEEIPVPNNKALKLAEKIVSEEGHEPHESESEDAEEAEEKPKKKSNGRKLPKELEEELGEE